MVSEYPRLHPCLYFIVCVLGGKGAFPVMTALGCLTYILWEPKFGLCRIGQCWHEPLVLAECGDAFWCHGMILICSLKDLEHSCVDGPFSWSYGDSWCSKSSWTLIWKCRGNIVIWALWAFHSRAMHVLSMKEWQHNLELVQPCFPPNVDGMDMFPINVESGKWLLDMSIWQNHYFLIIISCFILLVNLLYP